jgi:hypothetical protein
MEHTGILFLILGILNLGFDRWIADSMNRASIAFDVLRKHYLKQQITWTFGGPPWSRERFENWLLTVRVCGVVMILSGFTQGLILLAS